MKKEKKDKKGEREFEKRNERKKEEGRGNKVIE